MKYDSVRELVETAKSQMCRISDVVIRREAEACGRFEHDIVEEMARRVQVMREAIASGREKPLYSKSRMVHGGAYAYETARLEGKVIVGGLFSRIVGAALAVGEVNATMGRIVAAPTAGSSGVLPAAIIETAAEKGLPDSEVVRAMMVAGAVGAVIAKNATLSGAQGGCQAEVGSASAMAAAGLVEMLDGDPDKVSWAVSFALKNLMGLACDPVAGLVEVPCVKRNVVGAINAVACAEMAMAGLHAVIPADEVIVAMGEVGAKLPVELRETALGGVAACPSAKAFET